MMGAPQLFQKLKGTCAFLKFLSYIYNGIKVKALNNDVTVHTSNPVSRQL